MSQPSLSTESEVLADLRAWVEAESPSSDAAAVNKVVDLAESFALEMGCAVERIPGTDGFGDHIVIAAPWNEGSNEPALLVLCHLDTVHAIGAFGPEPFTIEGDRLRGPGAYDMKGGGVIALHALRSIIRSDERAPLPIRMLFTSDEEVSSPTGRPLIETEGARARYALVPEPARNGGKIVTSRRGVGRYQISAHGRAAHSGVNHAEGRSAIKEIARQILEIESWTDYARGVTLSVGKVWGGTTDNTVPEWAHATVDLRIDEPELADEIDARIHALKSVDPDVGLTVEGGVTRPPYKKTPEIQALFAKAKAIAAEVGVDLQDMHTGGGSDGNFIAATTPLLDGMGVDGEGAHTLNETVYVSSLVPRMIILRQLMLTLS